MRDVYNGQSFHPMPFCLDVSTTSCCACLGMWSLLLTHSYAHDALMLTSRLDWSGASVLLIDTTRPRDLVTLIHCCAPNAIVSFVLVCYRIPSRTESLA